MARALRSLGRLDEALGMQFELQREWKAEGGSDGYGEEEIGECLLVLGRGSGSRPWFARAWQSRSQAPWLTGNEPGRLKRMAELGGAAER